MSKPMTFPKRRKFFEPAAVDDSNKQGARVHPRGRETINGVVYPSRGTASRYVWDKCDEWCKNPDYDSSYVQTMLCEMTGLNRRSIVCEMSKWRTATKQDIQTKETRLRREKMARLMMEYTLYTGRKFDILAYRNIEPRELERIIATARKKKLSETHEVIEEQLRKMTDFWI